MMSITIVSASLIPYDIQMTDMKKKNKRKKKMTKQQQQQQQ